MKWKMNYMWWRYGMVDMNKNVSINYVEWVHDHKTDIVHIHGIFCVKSEWNGLGCVSWDTNFMFEKRIMFVDVFGKQVWGSIGCEIQGIIR